MGLPDIVIEFSKKAVTAIQSGALGIVGVILKDEKNSGAMILRGIDEIPTGDSAFSAENTAYLERAFMGAPTKVIVYTMAKAAEDYNEAFKYFASHKVNYLVGAPVLLLMRLIKWLHGLRVSDKRAFVDLLL